MPELYPFRLLPDFRERVWGAHDLSPIYAEVPGDKPIGEVWLTGDENRVADGPLAGSTLGGLCQRFGRELVGETAREIDRFPLLIKFLFPREKLSVQVHPDDEAARRVGQPCGKTECWYVLRAEEGAQIGLGLKPGTTREEFARAIDETRAEELLNWVTIRAGEMIYVDAGTVHTIGPGSVLVETQQNSDTTYRLYDYGRPRELHVRDGLQAAKERTRAGKVSPSGDGTVDVLLTSRCFAVNRYRLSGEHGRASPGDGGKTSRRSVDVVVGISGGGVVEAEGHPAVSFTRGEAVIVPACVAHFTVKAQWELEALSMYIPPSGAARDPETVPEAKA